jgi:hypothetical protein
LGLAVVGIFLGNSVILFFVFLGRTLPWLHDLDKFWFNFMHQQFYETWLINNQGLIHINNFFFSFNHKVLFFALKPILIKSWLLVDNRWCLMFNYCSVINFQHAYVLGLFISDLDFDSCLQDMFFVFLSFISFDPFLKKKFHVFCVFLQVWSIWF